MIMQSLNLGASLLMFVFCFRNYKIIFNYEEEYDDE